MGYRTWGGAHTPCPCDPTPTFSFALSSLASWWCSCSCCLGALRCERQEQARACDKRRRRRRRIRLAAPLAEVAAQQSRQPPPTGACAPLRPATRHPPAAAGRERPVYSTLVLHVCMFSTSGRHASREKRTFSRSRGSRCSQRCSTPLDPSQVRARCPASVARPLLPPGTALCKRTFCQRKEVSQREEGAERDITGSSAALPCCRARGMAASCAHPATGARQVCGSPASPVGRLASMRLAA